MVSPAPSVVPERDGDTPATSSPNAGAPVKSAARVLDILEDLGTRGPASLQVLAQRLTVPKSSLHALLRTLHDRGWLQTDASGTIFSLGIRALTVGAAYLDGDIVVARTSPILDELAQATGETVHLGRLEGDHIVYTAKRESSHPLRMYSAVGRRLPAYVTAMGRALLADRSPEDLEALVPEVLAPLTARTTVDRAKLNGILDAARATGFAIENEESCIGIACFAISLPFASPAVDAISIAVPISRLNDDVRSLVIEQLLAVRTRLQQQAPHRPLQVVRPGTT